MTDPSNNHADGTPYPEDPLDPEMYDSVFASSFQPQHEPVLAEEARNEETRAEAPQPVEPRISPPLAKARENVPRVEEPTAAFLPGPATETIPMAVFAVVAAMAVMPMFLTHMRHLSHMPHRAHYGFVLCGFFAIVLRRWQRAIGGPNLRLSVMDIGMLAGAGCAFATASRVGSPWIAVFSCVLLAGVFLRRLPSVDNIGYLGPWAFLLLLLPFPLGFDQKLIQALQTFATGCSSRLLDLLCVNHLVSGNVLELPGRQLFIDEACSGIQSLFAMLTCIAFFSAWTRRPAVLTIPLLAAGVVMCAIVNILRIVIVVHAEIQGLNLTAGWPHECLGAGLFVLALGLVYCSEGFFLYLLAPIINPATGTPDNRSARLWNSMTRSIHGAVFGVLEPEIQEELRPQQRGVLWFSLPTSVTRFAMITATVCFAFFGVAQHVGGADPDGLDSATEIEEAMLQRSEELAEDSLPETLGPWKRISFERVQKSRGIISDSVAWVYRSPFYEATVSLDYPFYGAHNVSECYHLTGWLVQERVTTEAGYSKATLTRPFGETALLFYDVFDSEGTVELESPKGKLAERLREFEDNSQRPTWQLQLIIRSDYGLSKTDLTDVELVFQAVRNRIRGKVTRTTDTGRDFPLEPSGPEGGVR